MAQRKKKVKRSYLVIAALIAAFIVFFNLGDRRLLPDFLQNSVDGLNRATGGIVYSSQTASAPKLRDLSVRFIDVGQGDSIFVYCDGESMLIDGGPRDADGKADKTLKSYGISSLKYVISTHPDEDHVGGLTDVVKDISVQNVIMSGAKANTQAFTGFLTAMNAKKVKATLAKPGSAYTLGGGAFTVFAPNREYKDTNDMSVVVRLVYKNRSVLFTGDASKKSEADMLKNGLTLKSDVLKVGHHGSESATGPEFLRAVSPQYAVISVGKGNNYGLPSGKIVERLKAAGIKIFRTDESGTVFLHSDGNTLDWQTEK